MLLKPSPFFGIFLYHEEQRATTFVASTSPYHRFSIVSIQVHFDIHDYSIMPKGEDMKRRAPARTKSADNNNSVSVPFKRGGEKMKLWEKMGRERRVKKEKKMEK